MRGTKRITACRACRTSWGEGEEPTCVDPSHATTVHVLHVHEDEVVVPGGGTIVGVSHDAGYERRVRPDFGLYLDGRWSPPWPHDHVTWPDFGLPSNVPALRRQLEDLLARSRRGQRVEVGCLGGHGRTGTLLACASVVCGHEPAAAVEWVRSTYCDAAVETPEQEAFVRSFLPPSR
jgi:hypothetical protein